MARRRSEGRSSSGTGPPGGNHRGSRVGCAGTRPFLGIAARRGREVAGVARRDRGEAAGGCRSEEDGRRAGRRDRGDPRDGRVARTPDGGRCRGPSGTSGRGDRSGIGRGHDRARRSEGEGAERVPDEEGRGLRGRRRPEEDGALVRRTRSVGWGEDALGGSPPARTAERGGPAAAGLPPARPALGLRRGERRGRGAEESQCLLGQGAGDLPRADEMPEQGRRAGPGARRSPTSRPSEIRAPRRRSGRPSRRMPATTG
jgi:hypothetical protein